MSTKVLREATHRIRALESEISELHRSIAAEPGTAQRELAAARLRVARAALQAASAPAADWSLIYDDRFLEALHVINQLVSEREEAGDGQQLLMFPQRKAHAP